MLPQSSFSDQIAAIGSALRRRYTNADGQPPAILYHYTDARGLIGMLESNSVWATDARFMNDPAELDWVREVVAAAAASMKLTNLHARLLAEELQSIEAGFPGSAYVASFSAHRDLLSQWRAYGGDGLGYRPANASRHVSPGFFTQPSVLRAEGERRTTLGRGDDDVGGPRCIG